MAGLSANLALRLQPGADHVAAHAVSGHSPDLGVGTILHEGSDGIVRHGLSDVAVEPDGIDAVRGLAVGSDIGVQSSIAEHIIGVPLFGPVEAVGASLRLRYGPLGADLVDGDQPRCNTGDACRVAVVASPSIGSGSKRYAVRLPDAGQLHLQVNTILVRCFFWPRMRPPRPLAPRYSAIPTIGAPEVGTTRATKPERTILIGHAGEAHARRRGVQKTILKNQTLD